MSRVFLVLGSGAREHALAWRLAQAPDAPIVHVAPGSDAMEVDPALRGRRARVALHDHDGLIQLARDVGADLTIVGPEGPLSAGVVDAFRAASLAVWGPTRAAAALESSKTFAKQIMDEAGVATASWRAFEDLAEARAHVASQPHPLVIKADGLAAGKGVILSDDPVTSDAALRSMMRLGRFGPAGARVVIEERLSGPELSFMVITDGERVAPLATSQDHKRLCEGDRGPNTGGMGAITPSPHDAPALRELLVAQVVRPVLRVMRERGTPYTGFLYVGVMLTPQGPRVLEFNARLGDPETQALMMAMEVDLGQVLCRAARGALIDGESLASALCACCVVMATRGYPEAPQPLDPITGLDQALSSEVKIFHAGTMRDEAGQWVTAGGRVLGVTARAPDAALARRRALEVVSQLSWPGAQWRRDIGD